MSEHSAEMARLDWRELASEPKVHYCDCDYCEMQGDSEPKVWPTLVTTASGEVAYVTDRYLMVRADRAPIPEGYEGAVLEGPPDLVGRWAEPPTDEPAAGLRFMSTTSKAIVLTGWRLVHLAHPDEANDRDRRRVGVVDEHGEHIGWALAQKPDEVIYQPGQATA